MIGIFEILSSILTVVSVFSVVTNLIQYTKKREQSKEIKVQIQIHYNNYFYMARAITRYRDMNKEDLTIEQKYINLENEVSVVRGICDSARETLVVVGREQFSFTPYFEHPLYPGKIDYSDEVLMGKPPMPKTT